MKSTDGAVLAGIGLMTFGCFWAAGNAAVAKGAMLAYPVGLVLLMRSVTAVSLVLPFASATQFLGAPHPRLQLLRAVLCGIEVPLGFTSLVYLPIVDVMTYYLAAPVYVTVISATILREPVGWRRWTAVLVGFAGVLIALRPSGAMLSWAAPIPLAGSIIYAGILTMTRFLRGTSDRVLLAGQMAGPLAFACVSAWLNWVTPTVPALLMMMSLGFLTLASNFCTNRALKLAPASVVVPYQYSQLLWGGLFGYLFFSEQPRTTTLIGAAIIVAAGLYIFMREQALARRGGGGRGV